MTNTYSTGNPLGSTALKDLSDNASNFDEAMNSSAPSFTDRFNKRRETLAGMKAAFDNFLNAAGYQDMGLYAAGIVLAQRNQVVEYNGEFYRVAGSTNIPYMLTGTWSTDSPKLVLVPGGSDALRQELASADGSTLTTYTAPAVGSVSRSLFSRLSDVITFKDFAPPTDGVGSVQSALVAANSANVPHLLVPPGQYLVTGNFTFNMPVTLIPGAVFIVQSGFTLKFGAGFEMPFKRQCFSPLGSAKIEFDNAFITIGNPEWWGAVTNSPVADCLQAINSCIVALPVTQLQHADYYTSDTVRIRDQHRHLWGYGAFVTGNGGQGSGARIKVKSSTADVLRVGLDSDPGDTNLYIYGNSVRHVQLTRTIAPTPPPPGLEVNGPCGLRTAYAQFYNYEFVSSEEHSLGFTTYGTIRGNFKNCYYVRSVPGTSATNDIAWGFYFPNGGQVGGTQVNASTYLLDCSGTIPYLGAVNSISLFFAGNARDSFVSRFESAFAKTGCAVIGSGNTTYGDIDIILDTLIVDAFTSNGLLLSGLSTASAVHVMNGYLSPISSAVGAYCFNAQNCLGMITMNGVELACATNPNTIGIGAGTVSGLITTGNMINYCKQPVVLAGCVSVSMRDMVHMPVAQSSPQPAIQLQGASNHIVMDTMVYGAANSYSAGISVSSLTALTEVRMSPINSSCLTVAANKLLYNGAQVTAAGTFGGTNLAQGIMG